jgi:phosphatidylserine/phosphatidylglycerophosphate/cardiolipin synthase-like enzyme
MKTHTKLLLLVLLLLVVFALVSVYQYRSVHEDGSIRVVMCPECEAVFQQAIRDGGTLHCALYDVGNETGAILASVNAEVITDDETNAAYGTPYVHSGLMHDKFCVNSTTVITGSYNPTDNGERNRNNLLIINSKALAENYEKEYQSMAKKRVRPSIHYTVWVNGIKVENYFCPTDSCEEHVLRALNGANEEILFMTYSFTSDPIGDLLLEKHRAGVRVEGICDEQQQDAYSECERLGAATWRSKSLLHHKVFIIDQHIIVTGSYNPTAGGDRRNRENVLIIDDAELAKAYSMEYTWVHAPD